MKLADCAANHLATASRGTAGPASSAAIASSAWLWPRLRLDAHLFLAPTAPRLASLSAFWRRLLDSQYRAAAAAVLCLVASDAYAVGSGDTNCDGVVNIIDVQLGITLVLGSEFPATVDANGNGLIDSCEGLELYPCGAGTYVDGGVCKATPVGPTSPLFCLIAGVAGDVVDCSLRVARGDSTLPYPTALQFSLDFDPNELGLDNFYAQLCFPGVGCFDVNLANGGTGGPPPQPLATGHTLTITPQNTANWSDGRGAVIVLKLSDPTTPLTTATWAGDTLIGDPDVLKVRFVLLENVSSTNPARVGINGVMAGDPDGFPQQMELRDGVLTTFDPELFPVGNINDDCRYDVGDLNCYSLAALTNAQGFPDPPCQAFPDDMVDLQCDGSINVTDVRRAILLHMFQQTGDPAVQALLAIKDPDLDGLHNNCDEDDDGDGFSDICEESYDTDPLDASSVPGGPCLP